MTNQSFPAIFSLDHDQLPKKKPQLHITRSRGQFILQYRLLVLYHHFHIFHLIA